MLFPIVAISLFLTHRREFTAFLSLLAVAIAAAALTIVPRMVGEAKMRALVRQGQRATAQITLR